MDGGSDPRSGCETSLHVYRLANVDDEGEPEVLPGQERSSPLLSLSLRVESVAVPVHRAGADAEHSAQYYHPDHDQQSQHDIPLIQAIFTLESAELDHIRELMADTESHFLGDIHVVEDEPVVPVNNIRNVMIILSLVIVLHV